jgi:hypothetical protein
MPRSATSWRTNNPMPPRLAAGMTTAAASFHHASPGHRYSPARPLSDIRLSPTSTTCPA